MPCPLPLLLRPLFLFLLLLLFLPNANISLLGFELCDHQALGAGMGAGCLLEAY